MMTKKKVKKISEQETFDTIDVERSSATKREVCRIAGWMKRANMGCIKIVGNRGSWIVTALSTFSQLAMFVSIEARYQSNLLIRRKI